MTVDEQKQAELFKEILKIKQEHLWDIGTLAPPPYIGVVNDTLRNVPKVSVYSDIARSPGSFLPEQFFYKN